MAKIQVVKIKQEKRIYLTELKNEKGEVRDEWLDRDGVSFIDPMFFDRADAGSIRQNKTPDKTNEINMVVRSEVEKSPKVKTSKLIELAVDLNCTECGKKFTRRDHLKVHVRTQHSTRTEMYCCSLCSSEFGYRANWKQHMGRKHGWTLAKASKNIENAKKDVTKATENIKSGKEKRPKRKLVKNPLQQDTAGIALF